MDQDVDLKLHGHHVKKLVLFEEIKLIEMITEQTKKS